MKLLICIIFIVISSYKITIGQSSNRVEVGIDISFRPAIGFNFGYYIPDKEWVKISYISIYALTFDGIIEKGEDYSGIINRGSYPDEVTEDGYSYDHFGIRLGISTNSRIIPYGIIGYRRASFVQNRYDQSRILANNGNYYISSIDNKESKIDGGIGIKILPSLNKQSSVNFLIEYSKLKSITIAVNWGFPIN
jgi:hypothetical protein